MHHPHNLFIYLQFNLALFSGLVSGLGSVLSLDLDFMARLSTYIMAMVTFSWISHKMLTMLVVKYLITLLHQGVWSTHVPEKSS